MCNVSKNANLSSAHVVFGYIIENSRNIIGFRPKSHVLRPITSWISSKVSRIFTKTSYSAKKPKRNMFGAPACSKNTNLLIAQV